MTSKMGASQSYETSNPSKPEIYEKLDSSRSEIRLARICLSSDDVVHCQLRKYPLDAAPKHGLYGVSKRSRKEKFSYNRIIDVVPICNTTRRAKGCVGGGKGVVRKSQR
jgi:hypothetical protein